MACTRHATRGSLSGCVDLIGRHETSGNAELMLSMSAALTLHTSAVTDIVP